MIQNFIYTDERFADLQLLRYRLNGFEELSARQKAYIYYLSQATLAGRDITTDQFGKYNLRIRKVLEAIYGIMGRKIFLISRRWNFILNACGSLTASIIIMDVRSFSLNSRKIFYKMRLRSWAYLLGLCNKKGCRLQILSVRYSR